MRLLGCGLTTTLSNAHQKERVKWRQKNYLTVRTYAHARTHARTQSCYKHGNLYVRALSRSRSCRLRVRAACAHVILTHFRTFFRRMASIFVPIRGGSYPFSHVDTVNKEGKSLGKQCAHRHTYTKTINQLLAESFLSFPSIIFYFVWRP